ERFGQRLRRRRRERLEERDDDLAERVVDAVGAVLLVRDGRARGTLADVGRVLRRDLPVEVVAVGLPGILVRTAAAIRFAEEELADREGLLVRRRRRGRTDGLRRRLLAVRDGLRPAGRGARAPTTLRGREPRDSQTKSNQGERSIKLHE